MHKLTDQKKIGYWRYTKDSTDTRPWPEENSWKDSEENKLLVIQFLNQCNNPTNKSVGQISYKGFSSCRICNKINGTLDIFDEKYCWPNGLVHYVKIHNVDLPKEFVDYIIKIS